MPTIDGTVAQNAARVPEREALVAGDRRWTWADLERDVRRVAATLDAAGLGHGSRITIMSGNSPEQVTTILAALRLGAIVVSVNTRLTRPEVAYLLRDSAPVVVATSAEFHDLVGAALDAGATPRPFLLHDLVAARVDGGGIEAGRSRESDDAFITYTSGTTGRPKGVLVDHHRAVWAAASQAMTMGLRDGERYLHFSPFYHAGGIVFLNAVTILGGTHVLMPAFEPAAALEAMERERITAFFGVPMMYQMLLREPGITKRDLSAWRAGLFGGAPMPEHTVSELLDLFPDVALFQMCGQTESGPAGLYSTTAQLRERPDSTGHQCEVGFEYRIVDPEGADVGPGGAGELLFRGEGIMKGYWNQPEATAAAVREGWLHTGDVFRVDPDGALVLIDRLKDVIITGNGQNIYSAEVEQVLLGHPAVADCAVIGIPHPVYGVTVAAVVAPRDGAEVTLASLQEHCAHTLARYKIPRELVIGAVPRNATGKVQKHLLRAEHAAATP